MKLLRRLVEASCSRSCNARSCTTPTFLSSRQLAATAVQSGVSCQQNRQIIIAMAVTVRPKCFRERQRLQPQRLCARLELLFCLGHDERPCQETNPSGLHQAIEQFARAATVAYTRGLPRESPLQRSRTGAETVLARYCGSDKSGTRRSCSPPSQGSSLPSLRCKSRVRKSRNHCTMQTTAQCKPLHNVCMQTADVHIQLRAHQD